MVEPMLPAPTRHPRGGRREKHDRRDIIDAILYVVRAGCAWRALPADFPPWQTVYWYFVRWHDDGSVQRVHDTLRDRVRAAEGRAADATAGVVDSQSVKGADTVGAGSRGYDAGKKTNGRKRFIVTDTLGLLLAVAVLAASAHDHVGGKRTLLRTYHDHPSARHVFADGGFAGSFIDWARDTVRTTVELVRKPPGQRGFEVLHRRWVVERTFAWLSAHRRLARDYERHPEHAETMIRWAMIGLMTRRLARGRPATRPGPKSYPELTS